MKTARRLFERMFSFENLYAAYRAARRGKRGAPAVAAFEYDQEAQLLTLRDELQAGAWQPGPYHGFYIHDPKRRLISAAPFRDRVVHHAVINVIEPLWEQRFIHDTYANRVGKGTHRALDRAQAFARRWPYVLQADIRQYFPSIDHAVVRAELARRIDDAGVLQEAYDPVWFAGDDLFAALRPRGLPIGNLTSQFWANVYLNDFDHFVKRDLGCRGYVRYVDDLLFFDDDKARLHAWRAALIERLAGLRLTLHEHRAQVAPVASGIPFLGFRLYPTHRRLKRRNGVNFMRRFRVLSARYGRATVSWADLDTRVRSWVNHARYADTWGLRRALLSAAPLPQPNPA